MPSASGLSVNKLFLPADLRKCCTFSNAVSGLCQLLSAKTLNPTQPVSLIPTQTNIRYHTPHKKQVS